MNMELAHSRKSGPREIPLPKKEPEIRPPKEPNPDLRPKPDKDPEIKPHKEEPSVPKIPPQEIPAPPKT